MLSFTCRVREERVELTYTSLHAAYPVIPQCYCLEIHTARATPTTMVAFTRPQTKVLLERQLKAAMALSHVSLSLLYPTPLTLYQCLVSQFSHLALHPSLNQLHRVGLGISQTKTKRAELRGH